MRLRNLSKFASASEQKLQLMDLLLQLGVLGLQNFLFFALREKDSERPPKTSQLSHLPQR